MSHLTMDALLILTKQDFLHPEVRAVLSCVCAGLRAVIAETPIDHTKIRYEGVAGKSYKQTMSLTEARKFRLTDDDLAELTFRTVRIRRYKKFAKYFSTKDVIALRLAKYGSLYVKKESAARARRLAQLKALNIDADHVCAESFVANGVGGVKALRERLELYARYDLCRDEGRRIFAAKLATGDVLREILEQREREREREARLRKALAARGLELRSDSFLCRRYIQTNVGDVGEIVNQMKIMHILHMQTNYIDVLHRLPQDMEDDERLEVAKRIVMTGNRFKHLFAWINIGV